MSLLRSLRLLARIPSVLCAAVSLASSVRGDEMSKPWPEDAWRREHRIIDLHQHIDSGTQRVQRALRIMDRVGGWGRCEPQRWDGDQEAGGVFRV